MKTEAIIGIAVENTYYGIGVMIKNFRKTARTSHPL